MRFFAALNSVLLISLARVASGDPSNFVMPGSVPGGPARGSVTCLSHPTRGYAGHGAPQPDRTTNLVLVPPRGRQNPEVTKLVCRGVTYTLRVTFASLRHALATASVGSLATLATHKQFTGVWGARNDACATRRLVVERGEVTVRGFTTTYAAIGNAGTASTVNFRITSASNQTAAYQAYSKTYRVGACPPVGK